MEISLSACHREDPFMIDYMAIGLVVFFGILGIVSGALLQVLRLGAAVVAIVVSLKYSPVIADAVPSLGSSMMMREYGLPVMLFAVLYMLMAMIIKLLVEAATGKEPKISGLSRALGFLLGGVCGILLAYFIVAVALNAQENSGRRMAIMDAEKSTFVKFVGEHPIPGLTKRAGAANPEEMKINIREIGSGVVDKVGKATGKALDEADRAIEQVEKKAGTAADKVEDKGGKIVDDAGEKAAQAGNEVVRKAGEAADDAAKAGNEAVEKVGRAAEKAGESLNGTR
jgi:uncharacterized membrane protein required for colicin V production